MRVPGSIQLQYMVMSGMTVANAQSELNGSSSGASSDPSSPFYGRSHDAAAELAKNNLSQAAREKLLQAYKYQLAFERR